MKSCYPYLQILIQPVLKPRAPLKILRPDKHLKLTEIELSNKQTRETNINI